MNDPFAKTTTVQKENKQAPPIWAKDGQFKSESPEAEAALSSTEYQPYIAEVPTPETRVSSNDRMLLAGLPELRPTPEFYSDSYRDSLIDKQLQMVSSMDEPKTQKLKDYNVVEEAGKAAAAATVEVGRKSFSAALDFAKSFISGGFGLREYLMVGMNEKPAPTAEQQVEEAKAKNIQLSINLAQSAEGQTHAKQMQETQKLMAEAGLASAEQVNQARNLNVSYKGKDATSARAIAEGRAALKEREKQAKQPSMIDSGKGKSNAGQPTTREISIRHDLGTENKAAGITGAVG